MKSDNFDTAVDALGHSYRRKLLVTLLDTNPCTNPQDAIRALETTRGDSGVGTRGNGGVGGASRMETNLVHNHLPKLEEPGYIRWDRETGEIRRGPRWDRIKPLLELLCEHKARLPDGWP